MSLLLSPLARRAFWSREYARRRLGTERASSLAELHYALAGERLGYRPNGFFDPGFFRQAARTASRTGLLELYLTRPEADAPAPSAEFDHGWYAAQNPEWRRTHPHPFLHFLEAGMRSGRRPRADIDMFFVRDVIRGGDRSIEEAALRVFDPKPRDGDVQPPLSREEMTARQDRFYADTRMRIKKEPAQTRRNRLVFVQCGRGFDSPYLREPRAFDVLLNLYEEGEASQLADAIVFQRGTKTTAIRRLLDERPDLILRYAAVILLDDDVEVNAEAIDALFTVAEREGLDLAQPALTADSESAWPFLKKLTAGDGIVRVSSVEIMAPLMTGRALDKVGWAFSQTVSGWGADLLLGPAVRGVFGPRSVGVVGSVAVRHARKVDTRGGAFYAYLRSYGIDPAYEANRMVADFGVERYLRRLEPGEAGPVLRPPSDRLAESKAALPPSPV